MASRSSKLKDKQEIQKFDPRKNYQWQTDDVFAITGLQLDVLHKVISLHINSPEVQRALALQRASEVLTAIMTEGYEEGIIKEVSVNEPIPEAPVQTP